ncbi:MAG: nucleotidyltransferase family protein [Anaerolineae bacterium]|nr:nucleotidyltransferase family protein [Anaerolineae bacterium]
MTVSLKEVYRLSLQLSPDERRQLVEFLRKQPEPTDPRQILAAIESSASDLRALSVERIGVFGSAVRGEADAASDIDILVKLAEPSFRDFMRVKYLLEDLLGRRVDLVLEDSLRDELRSTVLSEVIYAGGF